MNRPKEKIFTDNQIEILKEIAKSKGRKQICKALTKNINTLDATIQKMYERAGVKNMVGLLIFALKNEVLTLADCSEKDGFRAGQ